MHSRRPPRFITLTALQSVGVSSGWRGVRPGAGRALGRKGVGRFFPLRIPVRAPRRGAARLGIPSRPSRIHHHRQLLPQPGCRGDCGAPGLRGDSGPKSLRFLLVFACSVGCAGLLSLALATPPVHWLWRMPGLAALGLAVGLLNAGLFQAIAASYSRAPVRAVALGGSITAWDRWPLRCWSPALCMRTPCPAS